MGPETAKGLFAQHYCTRSRVSAHLRPNLVFQCDERTRRWKVLARASSLGSGNDSAGDPPRLDGAADAFARGVAAGVDEDDLVARQLGMDDPSQMSVLQDKYKEKIKAKLETRAEELKKEREARARKFAQGKVAYERGQYPSSVTLLEAALNEEGPFTQLGGEIQMWLALAYQACGREEDCIEMYKSIEKSHPLPAIRRQAADLRYIMEAPKLQLGEDEKVKIPVLTDLDPATRGGRAPLPRSRTVGKTQTKPKSWDEEFWESYKPPQYLKNKYVWAASFVLFLGIVLYSLGYLHF